MADVGVAVAELLHIADNKLLLDRLVRQVVEHSVIPFVGAGLSAPYNLPQWSALIQRLAPDKASRAHVDHQLQGGLYEEAAEYLMKIRGLTRFQLVSDRSSSALSTFR